MISFLIESFQILYFRLSTGVRPETVFMNNQGLSTGLPYLPTQSVNFGQNSSINPIVNPTETITVQSPSTLPVQDQQQQHPQPQPQPQPQQQNQRRFPNIIHDDVQENRDWLDVFYSMSRLMVLLTLVYLYSSPLRCLLVFVIGMGIYL